MSEPRTKGRGWTPRGAAQISEIANRLVDPVLARRAGISTELIGVWDEIAGESFADCTRPEKIAWPRRISEGEPDGGYEPGVLTVACEGARALFLTHRQGELIQRINGFFGFPAISRLRIVQKPVSTATRRPRIRPLTGEKAERLKDMTDGIENEALKAALSRLGTGVMQKRGR